MNQAIIIAAGSSVRMKGVDKTFVKILGQSAIWWTIVTFENHPQIAGIVLVGKKADQKKLKDLVKRNKFKKVLAVTQGGLQRQDSVFEGLKQGQKLGWQKNDLVMIQDGARILVTEKEITNALIAAQSSGAAVVGVLVKDTIHKVDKEGLVAETPSREALFAAQTPQVLRFDLALSAFSKAEKEKRLFTDDVSLAKHYHPKLKVKIAAGSYENLKLTTPEDLATIENILKARQK